MKNIKLKYHAYYWLFDFTFQCVILLFISGTSNFSLDLLIIFINVLSRAGFFYVVLIFILPIFYNQQKYLSTVILLLLSASSFASLDGKISKATFLNISSLIAELSFFQVSVDNFLDLIIVILPTAFAFYFIDQNIAIAEEQRAIEHQNNLLEQSIIKEKLSGLRMQINPAFLERTLAYFYRESLPYSPNLSKGITLLSDMMKYALNEDDKEGKVPLKNEIKHIRNFIEIQQLRFDNRLQVHFEVSGEVKTNLLCLCY